MEMSFVAVRYALGYLLQVAPCAVLCLLPFTASTRRPLRRVVCRACLAVAAGCAVFVFVSLAVLDAFVDSRVLLANLLFLVLLAVLLLLFWREVEASRACKTFTFLLVAVYGAVITIAIFALGIVLELPEVGDHRLYSPAKLCLFAVLDAATLPLGYLLMARVVRPLVTAGLEDKSWQRMCLFPAGALVLLVGVYWVPSIVVTSDRAEVALLVGVLVIGAAAAFVWAFSLMRDLRRQAEAQADMASRVDELEREREELRSRSGELREEATSVGRFAEASSGHGAKVMFETPSKVLALDVTDILYLEVFGHRLVIHVRGGRAEELGLSLTQARDLLPADRFVQCHRSYLVNKDAVRSLRRYELMLEDGESVPVSKQRYREVEEALRA